MDYKTALGVLADGSWKTWCVAFKDISRTAR